MRQHTRALSLFVSLLCAACVTSGGRRTSTRASVGPWLEPSPHLRMQIEDQVERLPWTSGVERIELIQWFATVGEPAYPTLLELATDERSHVAGAALAALGATGDSRLVEPMRSLAWPDAAHDSLRLERARALLRLGDWSMVPILIDGLEAEHLMVRALCGQALYESTRERFGFEPGADEAARAAAVGRWRTWWDARRNDPLIGGGEAPSGS